MGASSKLMYFETSLDFLHISSGGHTFFEPIREIPESIYLFIVGVG